MLRALREATHRGVKERPHDERGRPDQTADEPGTNRPAAVVVLSLVLIFIDLLRGKDLGRRVNLLVTLVLALSVDHALPPFLFRPAECAGFTRG